jgi:hypothetical protein
MRKLLLLTSTAMLAFGMVVAGVATAGVSSAECDGGRTWDPVAKLCDPPPPMPAWYQVPPTYAQPWAPPWAPPPPPPTQLQQWLHLQPVWDPRFNAWSWVPQGGA